ncbi:hypothetical protein KSP40_PGU010987 [Platanthera guangdongensis]|uniref:Uncharacterized protein n=1 Tax=Platanthera guangdongensis TaxID=2320717 RepID=A0ABR2M3M5_9ASPA
MAYRLHGEHKLAVKFVEGNKEGTDGLFKSAHESPLFPNLQLMFKNKQHQSHSEIPQEVVTNKVFIRALNWITSHQMEVA